MPALTAPSSITVSRLYRVFTGGLLGGKNTLLNRFEIRGRVSWVNTVTDPHEVEITVSGQRVSSRYVLPKGSQNFDASEQEVVLAEYVAPEMDDRTVTITAKLLAGDDSSTTTTATATISPLAKPALTSSMTVADSSGVATFSLPTWSGVVNAQRLDLSEAEARVEIGGYPLDKFFAPRITDWSPATIRLTDASGRWSEQSPPYPQVLPRPTLQMDSTRADISVSARLLDYDVRAELFGLPSIYLVSNQQAGWIYTYRQRPALTAAATLYSTFSAAAFAAVNKVVQITVGKQAKILLEATHPATWAIDSGAPAQFNLVTEKVITARGERVVTHLVGTPISSGGATVQLTATRVSDSATATATVDITVTNQPASTLLKTVVTVNPGWLNNGLAFDVGDEVKVSLGSTPLASAWRASGLPPGLSIDPVTGLIYGSPTAEGRWMVSVFATAEGYQESDAAYVAFTVQRGTQGAMEPPAPTAKSRIPWILDRWDLIDLQIHARSRLVESTLMEGTKAAVRIKIGDDVKFATFYLNGRGVPFDPGLASLQIKIRPENNLESSLVLATVANPAPRGGAVDPGIGELSVVAATGPSKVTIAGATSGASRAGGGTGEATLVFRGPSAPKDWTFGFRGGEGDTDFVLGELVTITRASGYTALPVFGDFKVATIDITDDAADPWIVLTRPDPQPWFLLAAKTGSKERDRALEWVEDSAKNEPIPCVGEVEATVGSEVYSSQFFPVALELDVVRAG